MPAPALIRHLTRPADGAIIFTAIIRERRPAMARPIASTPTLRGAAAKRFIELAENPPPLKPVKLLTKKEVKKLLKGIIPKEEK